MKLTNNKLVAVLAAMIMSMVLTAPAVGDDKAKIKERLKQLVQGDVSKVEITPTSLKGLYQIQLGLTVVYMSADGKYMLNGNMLDLENDKNLTKMAQAKVRKAAMAKVDKSGMIVYPAKNEKHSITVFTDIDCPYCKKLHREIPDLNKAGISVRYVAYPRSGVRDRRTGQLTKSYQTMVSVWCADDKAKMMDDAMVGIPPEVKSCDNPVQEHMMHAQMLEVNGTPNIIFENGDLYPGYVPAKELIKLLNKS